MEPDIEEEHWKRTDEAIAIRNVVVHNRGCVDKTFKQRTGKSDLTIGQELDYELEYVAQLWLSLMDVAYQIDAALVTKYPELVG